MSTSVSRAVAVGGGPGISEEGRGAAPGVLLRCAQPLRACRWPKATVPPTHRFWVLEGLVQLCVGHDGVPFADPPQHPLKRLHLPLLDEAGHESRRNADRWSAEGSGSHPAQHPGDEHAILATGKEASDCRTLTRR